MEPTKNEWMHIIVGRGIYFDDTDISKFMRIIIFSYEQTGLREKILYPN